MSDELTKPWHRQKGETRKAFHAFVHYRDQQPHERSLSAAYNAHRRDCAPAGKAPATDRTLEPPPTWKNWKRTFQWDARCDAHDADVADKARETRVREIEAMNARHAAIASAFQNQVINRLTQLTQQQQVFQLSAGQMVQWLKEATLIERRARGEATEIVRHEGQGDKGAPLDLSALSEEELGLFEQLAAKVGVSLG